MGHKPDKKQIELLLSGREEPTTTHEAFLRPEPAFSCLALCFALFGVRWYTALRRHWGGLERCGVPQFQLPQRTPGQTPALLALYAAAGGRKGGRAREEKAPKHPGWAHTTVGPRPGPRAPGRAPPPVARLPGLPGCPLRELELGNTTCPPCPQKGKVAIFPSRR